MSNLIINWRFWYWHFQIRRDPPYMSFGRNWWRWDRLVGEDRRLDEDPRGIPDQAAREQ